MQNSIYVIKYLLFLSWDWQAWCSTVWGVIPPPPPERNTAWNKGRKCFHCLRAPNNLIRPWMHCQKSRSRYMFNINTVVFDWPCTKKFVTMDGHMNIKKKQLDIFISGFVTKTICAFLLFASMRATCRTHFTPLDFITLNIWRGFQIMNFFIAQFFHRVVTFSDPNNFSASCFLSPSRNPTCRNRP